MTSELDYELSIGQKVSECGYSRQTRDKDWVVDVWMLWMANMASNRLEVKYIVFDKLLTSFDLWWQSLVTLIAIWLSFVHWNWQNLVNLSKNTLDCTSLYKTAQKRQIFNQCTRLACKHKNSLIFHSTQNRVEWKWPLSKVSPSNQKAFKSFSTTPSIRCPATMTKIKAFFWHSNWVKLLPPNCQKRTSSSSSTQNKNVQMIEFIRNRISFNR